MSAIEELLDVMRSLRSPDGGCLWDQRQSFQTIAPYTLEEAYEVADAIARNDMSDLRLELGDLLFQVVFHAQMAEEIGEFDFNDVAAGIVEKMIRRHPHVFADAKFANETELKQAWEAEKARERIDKKNAQTSALDDIAMALPALKRADKIQKRAARVGFDWSTVEPVREKILEELKEVDEAIAASDSDAAEDEIGDLLFAVVNLARHLNIDAEKALSRANRKFSDRFRQVEQLAEKREKFLSAMTPEELDELWNRAKSNSESV